MPACGTERAIAIYRLEDGKIAEVWAQIDTLGLLRQLGAAPA
ncbi:MAG: ester cyclase [Alphaproteobacteria bacterium]|nr:ester cyclase [Alphaproteobacteria bacterium]MDE2494690.1 ester cyclase [Alphaproteobacteria bacterium]